MSVPGEYEYDRGQVVGRDPLCELRAVPLKRLQEDFCNIAERIARGGHDRQFGEYEFYNTYPGQRLPLQVDYSDEHTVAPEFVSERIQGVQVQCGTFVDVARLDEAQDLAAREQFGHFVDERGSLTPLLQEGFDRMEIVFEGGEIPGELHVLFDAQRSSARSCYTSETKLGEARDHGFVVGKKGLHVHLAQSDRFIFTDGCWEILLIDVRPHSPTQGQRVFLSFDAGQDHQLAMVIPPGIAHSVACLRPSDSGMTSARLVNFPTLGYGEIPEGLEVPEGLQAVAKAAAIRLVEGRLDAHRIESGRASEDVNEGTVATWRLYQRWLLNKELLMQRERDPREKILLLGGSKGLLGSVLENQLGGTAAIEAISRSQTPQEDVVTMQCDLTKLSVREIRDLILASGTELVVLTAAWTDVKGSIVLKSFSDAYDDALSELGLLGTDPVTEANVQLVTRVAQACESFRRYYGRNVRLLLPQSTMAGIDRILPFNLYAATKRAGAAAVREIMRSGGLVELRYGYPYVIDQSGISATAKGMLLRQRIREIVAVLKKERDRVLAFDDDALDLTDLSSAIGLAFDTDVEALRGVLPKDIHLTIMPGKVGWISSYDLCSMIVEVCAEAFDTDPKALISHALQRRSGNSYQPTNRQLLIREGRLDREGVVMKWLSMASQAINNRLGHGTVDLEAFLDQPSRHFDAYPHLSDIPSDRLLRNNPEALDKLREAIRQILIREHGLTESNP
jgi:nucleoside-diphosphate-sugar epimerase